MSTARWLYILFLLPAFNGISQEITEREITVQRHFGGMRFEMDTLTLTHRQVSELLYVNPAASKEFKIARRLNTVSAVLGFSGAVLVAIPVVNAILGGDPQWGMAAAGGLLIVGSIPLSASYKGKAEHAIDTYNTDLKLRGRFYLKGVGVGIRL